MSSNNNLPTFSDDNYHLIKTINNNEIYEKLRPLDKLKNTFRGRQAHGDDTQIQPSKDQEKPLELFSYETQPKSSSNEFLAMRITDTSNEALKTDDENGMTKSYYHQKGNDEANKYHRYLFNFRKRNYLK
jgi:hypothetical protein